MRIYNSLTNKEEEFVPIKPGKISMYVCGPTVYSYAHVGNMRPVIFFDTVYRYFKYLGYDVEYSSNFTDVDDKIINAAIELNLEEKEITQKFIDIYLKDVQSFNCLDIDYRPKVTETMEDIIKFIELLLEKGYAYKNGDDVYFRTNKVNEYGSLSNQNKDALIHGSRIEVNTDKENSNDFVLWKKTDKGIKWNAPFGEGRPGWHTECVVMINKIFDGKIDIHGGGIDLKFPHHENEMAQSYAAWNHSLANFWIHNGHIMVNGEKMSKSLNNFILAHELREKYSSNTIRIGMLKTHYRLPLNLTDTLFYESSLIEEKVYNALKQANIYVSLKEIGLGAKNKDKKLEEIMNDDFNTSNLVTYLLDLIKELNNSVRNNLGNVGDILDTINLVNYVLGLEFNLKALTQEELEIYSKWEELRIEKNFEEADKLREELIRKGVL